MITKALLCALPVTCIQQGYAMIDENYANISKEQNNENFFFQGKAKIKECMLAMYMIDKLFSEYLPKNNLNSKI